MAGVPCKKKKEYVINCCSQSRFLPPAHTQKNADELESDNATADYAKERKFTSFGENNLNERLILQWTSTQFHNFLCVPPGYLTLQEKAAESCQLDSLQIMIPKTMPSTLLRNHFHFCLPITLQLN